MNTRNLSLYHYDSCPFCARVRNEIQRMKLDIELRDIRKDPSRRAELIAGGGMQQVPCLRIEQDSGEVTWMYESLDIIGWLRDNLSPA